MITENEILELIEKKRQNYIDASLKIWDWAEPIFRSTSLLNAWLDF